MDEGDRKRKREKWKFLVLLTFRSFEEDGDQRGQVPLGVPEGEVEAREASPRDVLDVADVLDVGGILALARHPHYVCL